MNRWRMASSVLFLATLAAPARGGPAGDHLEAAYARIDALVERRMKAERIPGMAMTITDRDRLLRVKTYGYADLAARTPLTPDHPLEIGSVSKSFTAIALLQEREAGRFDPRAPITRYLPWLKLDTRFAPITGHHLLTHTAGLPGTRDDILSPLYQALSLAGRPTGWAPGKHYEYSNFGYQLLGLILEELDGKPYPEIIRRRILEPLGMAASEPAITHDTRRRLAVGYEPLYDDRPDHPSQPLAPATWLEYDAGDGSIAATPADLAAYLRMLLGHGAGPRGRLLSEESFGLLVQRAIPTDDEGHYGYGLIVEERDGHTLVRHTGGMVGYYTMVLGDLDEGLGVTVQINGPGDRKPIARYVLAAVRAAVHGEEIPPLPAEDPAPVPEAAAYAGEYVSPEGGRLTLVADGDRLLLAHAGGRLALEAQGDDRFRVPHPDFALFLLAFGREKGAVVEAWHGGDWYAGPRYNGPRAFRHPSAWDAYPGHYRSQDPWFSNFRVVLRKGALWLVTPGDAAEDEQWLTPLGPGAFRVGEAAHPSGTLRFDGVVRGKAQRATYSGEAFYRTFTP
jgi:CubicO group peptidase (beta-lactamase class C family)